MKIEELNEGNWIYFQGAPTKVVFICDEYVRVCDKVTGEYKQFSSMPEDCEPLRATCNDCDYYTDCDLKIQKVRLRAAANLCADFEPSDKYLKRFRSK